MGYYASFNGELTPRKGRTKEEIEKALEMFGDYYENKDDAGVLSYEVSGDSKYYKEDYDDLAKVFDGQVDFTGGDDAKWSLFLEDGQVKETSPIEITVLPGERPEDVIGKYITLNKLNVRQILETNPDFLGGKLWYKEDIAISMDEMGIDKEMQEKILPEAFDMIDKRCLDECTQEERNAIEYGIKDAIEKVSEREDLGDDGYEV